MEPFLTAKERQARILVACLPPISYQSTTEICEHDRIRNQFKKCLGSSVCTHERRRRRCKECKPSSRHHIYLLPYPYFPTTSTQPPLVHERASRTLLKIAGFASLNVLLHLLSFSAFAYISNRRRQPIIET